MAVQEKSRRRAAAALIAVTGVVVALIASLSPAASADPAARAVPAAVTPVTTTSGKTTLQVDSATGINPVGGTITVSGSGFDPTSQLYVAICLADGKAPADLTECVGGAVPDGNQTQAWAFVTKDGAAPPKGGGVTGRWANDGSFSLGLVLPATSAGIDCLKAACAVYTTEPAPGTGSRLSIPVGFAAATSSASTTQSSTTQSSTTESSTTQSTTSSSTISSTTESSTTSSSSIAPPSTVAPESVKSASIVAGGTQRIVFAGFIPGEKVSVTLFSAPVQLPEVTTDAQGVVTIDFMVPKELAIGTHIVQAIGATSHNTGIARFVVTAPPVTPSTTVSSPPSSALSSTPASSTVSSVSSTPVTTSSIAVTSSAPVTTTSPPITPPASNPKPVWPWYVLGMIVLICVIIGLVALGRRRTRLAAENADRDQLLAQAAAEEQYRADEAAAANAAAPTTFLSPYADPGGPPPMPPAGYRPDAHGLLSGRENADDPGLLSGQDYEPPPPEARTVRIPPVPDRRPPVPDQPEAGDDPGPPTSRWTPPEDDDDEPPSGGRHAL